MKKSIVVSLMMTVLLSGGAAGTPLLMNASMENHRPDAPTINGPTSVKIGAGHTWTFNSTDPDGDNLTYYVDWGDVCGGAEWHGPYPSGVAIGMDHTYQVENVLLINSMAVDEHGAESNMTYFEVNITISVSLDCMFQRLFGMGFFDPAKGGNPRAAHRRSGGRARTAIVNQLLVLR